MQSNGIQCESHKSQCGHAVGSGEGGSGEGVEQAAPDKKMAWDCGMHLVVLGDASRR